MTPMERLEEYAMRMVGLPYIWGGDDPILGFDCSGLVQELLASIGADPAGDQTAQALYDYFRAHGAKTETKGLGALCFYGKSLNQITHVAMMLDETTICEAGGGGSASTNAAKAAALNAFVRVRPYNRRADLVAVLMPKY